MANDEPIYKFERLKSLLKSMGYRIVKPIGYKPLKIEDVDINDIRKNIKFTDKGIFVIDDEDNQERQIFLYKRNYRLTKYRETTFSYSRVPDNSRFHKFRNIKI